MVTQCLELLSYVPEHFGAVDVCDLDLAVDWTSVAQAQSVVALVEA